MIFYFTSAQTGAPALSGTAGKLTDLFTALFVDGFNSHVSGVTVSQTGGTATLSKTAHGYVAGNIIRVSGFDQAGYNIDAKVLTAATDSLTYAVDSGTTSPGTGTGAVKRCPLDWTAYANPGTNIKAWQSLSGTGQYYLAINDSGTTSARLKGFLTLTANPLTSALADAEGTGAMPTAAQFANGVYLHKSNSADANARSWWCISDGYTLHFVCDTYNNGTSCNSFSFGKFTSYKSTTDNYTTFIMGSTSASLSSGEGWYLTNAALASHFWISANYSGTLGSIGACKPVLYWAVNAGNQPGSSNSLNYPALINAGSLFIQRFHIVENVSAPFNDMRGHLPGLWFPWHRRPITIGDTFSGAAGSSLAGRTFISTRAPADGQVYFETSDTWD